jgi:adenine-specific DNA-methyltransferase
MIKYIGSKRVLVPHIVRAVSAFPESGRVLDLFSGTSRVAHGLKETGRYVIANDHLAYAATLARCYVQADANRWLGEATRLLAELSEVRPKPGYFTKAFCEDARYFQAHNGARVDAIREEIARRALPLELEAVALVSLMEAADRVDSTTGVQMAYLKQWASRAHNDLTLRVPALLPGPGEALQLDAVEAASRIEADIVYMDPPYNQHSYMGNYHVWESLVRWDKPESYGIANKRMECKEYKSDFNSKRRIRDGLRAVFAAVRCKHLLLSFNNEGHVNRDEMTALLGEKGHVGVVAVDFKRYVGAQIGIHSPNGEKVGRVSHLRNKEYFFIVSERRDTVDRVVQALESSIEGTAFASGLAKDKRKGHESERCVE